MPNSKIILTKSSQANATPHPNDLDFGELAINYEDGLLFFKNTSNRISKIASSGSFSQLQRHLSSRENPHEVDKNQVGLDRVDNTTDAEKQISDPTAAALLLKADLTTLNNYYTKGQTEGFVEGEFDSISIKINEPNNIEPAGFLTYTPNNKTFTFTKATIPTLSDLGGVALDGITITPVSGNPGTGSLLYEGDGEFTYDKPTIGGLGGYAKQEIGLDEKSFGTGDGSLTYNDGKFTYDKPLISGLTGSQITFIDNVLTVTGYATSDDLADLTVKEGEDIGGLQDQIDDNDEDITALQNKDTSLQNQINNKVTNLGAVTGIQQLTQAAYNSLTPDASTVYIIVG